MITKALTKIFGSRNTRLVKRMQQDVARINALEPAFSQLTDEQLRAKTAEFKTRLSNGETLDGILHEAFAVVREASQRTLGMRHFDVQLMGGMVLHQGKISEMRTGEGKTLVATLPVYLNALSGKGMHVVTVNDYLARRDAEWMGQIYKFLGMSVGVVVPGQDRQTKREAYAADITYGTNNEYGFDYLRDNMAFRAEERAQRGLNYAIVDEVDSILIDEARTPLIISGPTEESTDKYYKINKIIPFLKETQDYTLEEKTRTVALTEEGNAKVERLLGLSNLYDISNIDMVHHVIQALKAHTIFKRDVDYVVKDGEVLIVDEFTGRLMPGRRYSDGLHQALEAKENVTIAQENQTLASITFQNYFRLYNKLAGMTGTADTEAAEFQSIYKLDVVVIPPNKPMIRIDNADQVYKTEREKFNAIVDEITDRNKKGQPALVGTVSIENSEKLSELLKKKGIKHTVLNAKFHEMEAEIVAQAGRKGAVTIATNMAGRGTDILLGGNPDFLAKREFAGQPDLAPEEHDRFYNKLKTECDKEKEEVIKAGGLHIVGSERHEARRIDNQLRGRSGRQGDPGSSRFYLALEDDLMRIFGSDKIAGLMNRLGMEEGTPIEHRMVSKAIENAQKKVEAHNFDIRKHLIEYDDVMNQQRTVIYSQRRQILQGEGLTDIIFDMIEDLVDENLSIYCGKDIYPEEWDIKGLKEALTRQFSLEISDGEIDFLHTGIEGLKDILLEKLLKEYADKEAGFTSEVMRQVEKVVLLQVVDTHWKDHLLSMDHLKEGIGLRGYGQKDPLIEYKREGFDMFNDMINRIKSDAVERVFKIQLVRQPEPAHHGHQHHQPHEQQQHQPGQQTQSQESQMQQQPQPQQAQVRPPVLNPMQVMRPQRMQLNRGVPPPPSNTIHKAEKVGRNDPCTCGSGKKYKKCHGA